MKKKTIILLTGLVLMLMACSDKGTPSNGSDDNSDSQAEQSNNHETAIETEDVPDAPLQKGDETAAVSALQQVLHQLDYPVELSGKFDDVTTWALTDIQLQNDDLHATGLYDEATKNYLEELTTGEDEIEVGKELAKPENPDVFPADVENPYDVLAIANKGHALPGDYEPEDLTVPDIRFPFEEDDPKKQLRAVAADAIEALFVASDEAGVNLFGQSGFRSYDRQEAIFASNTDLHGEEHANTYSAKAGESEHQTGLVMDVTSQAVGFDLNTDFGETEEGKWLAAHAHEYGFIIRYPEDKVKITKYQYEPWHIRFVGEQAATDMYENNETLEEYFGLE